MKRIFLMKSTMNTIPNNLEPKRPLFWLLACIAMFIITVITIPEVSQKCDMIQTVAYVIICLVITIFTAVIAISSYDD